MARHRGWQWARQTAERKRGLARATLKSIEILAALATVGVLAIGLVKHFQPGSNGLPGEGKRVIAFSQITSRICTEHRDNLQRALAQSASQVERLQFVARAIGWNLNDLEGITPPPSRSTFFSRELDARRRSRAEILALQHAIELGNEAAEAKAKAIAALEALHRDSRELSRENGVNRCIEIVPPIENLLRN